MKYFGVGNQAFVNFFWRQAGIRPRFAGKGKISIAGSVQGYERQRGENGGVNQDAFGFDARIRQRFHQQAAKSIVAHLADHGGFGSVFCQRSQEMRR